MFLFFLDKSGLIPDSFGKFQLEKAPGSSSCYIFFSKVQQTSKASMLVQGLVSLQADGCTRLEF